MQSQLIPSVTLSNGVSMPSLGFGVAGLGTGPEFYTAMESALENGYRFFDTAPFYENEGEVGQVLRSCGVPRESGRRSARCSLTTSAGRMVRSDVEPEYGCQHRV